jgi:hypothetical protein
MEKVYKNPLITHSNPSKNPLTWKKPYSLLPQVQSAPTPPTLNEEDVTIFWCFYTITSKNCYLWLPIFSFRTQTTTICWPLIIAHVSGSPNWSKFKLKSVIRRKWGLLTPNFSFQKIQYNGHTTHTLYSNKKSTATSCTLVINVG